MNETAARDLIAEFIATAKETGNEEVATLIATALTANDETAATYIVLQTMGAMITPTAGGWEVTYDPEIDAGHPWRDDLGSQFATAEVGTL